MTTMFENLERAQRAKPARIQVTAPANIRYKEPHLLLEVPDRLQGENARSTMFSGMTYEAARHVMLDIAEAILSQPDFEALRAMPYVGEFDDAGDAVWKAAR